MIYRFMLILSLLSVSMAYGAKTANRCYNPATKSTVFSDTSCETNGYIAQGSTRKPALEPSNDLSSYRSRINTYRAPTSTYDYGRLDNKGGSLGNDKKRYLCASLRQRIDSARDTSDALYQWNKEDCANAGR